MRDPSYNGFQFNEPGMVHPELIALFFAVALLYASAGFGGGSSYLAILALWGLPMAVLRPAALLCNLVVVSGNILTYWRARQINWQKTLPLALTGIPLAFLGGYLKLSERVFFILLGFSLIVAAIAMWLQNRAESTAPSAKSLSPKTNLGLGGSLGFLAGLTGIGGGIFLSPVLHLLRWDAPKTISAAASFFILCQSAAGLGGQIAQGILLQPHFLFPLLMAVALGGRLGVYWSTHRFPQKTVRNITGLLVFYAGLNLLWQYL